MLDRANGDPERGGGLLQGKLLEIVQVNRLPEIIRQGVDIPPDCRGGIAIRQSSSRASAGRRRRSQSTKT